MRTRRRTWALVGAGLLAAFFVAINSSILASPGPSGRQLVAHRGVAQTFDLKGVDSDTCTASRIRAPTHGFIENTAPSFQAAVLAGADRVEVDVRVSADGRLVVFHDHGLDCRTDGHGRVRDVPLSILRELDLGYGYTADGETFPLRGAGRGLLMTLPELLERFSDAPLLLDLKGLSAEEGVAVAHLVADRRDVWVGGSPRAVVAFREVLPAVHTVHKAELKECLVTYVAVGWTGWVPSVCRGQVVAVPSNYAPWMWGWPHRFTQRMASVGAVPLVVGPRLAGEQHSRGVDDAATLQGLGAYRGAVLTNEITTIGAVPGW